MLVLGVVYWFLFARALPYFGGYSIEVEKHMLENGAELVRYKALYPLLRFLPSPVY